MDLEEIISKYNGIADWTKKIASVTNKASTWKKAFVDGMHLLYPLSGKRITIPTDITSTSIIIAHKLWVHNQGYAYKREPHYGDTDIVYRYKEEIIKRVKKEKRDALMELIVLAKKANKQGGYRTIKKDVGIDIFILKEGLSSYLTKRQEHVENITVTFSESGYIRCICTATGHKTYSLDLSTHPREIKDLIIMAQIYDALDEICRDFYKEVKRYVGSNIKIAQQMEDAVVQFKVANKLSQ